MKVIGITGGIGSGKSTVSDIIKKHKYPLIDCDEISHELTQRMNCLKRDKGMLWR